LNEQRGRSMTREQAIEFVKKKCSEAVKAWFKRHRIYRGVQNAYGPYASVKPTTERLSANTLNYYTLFINNSSVWKEYPKRQIIATTDEGDAFGYGYLYLVLPVNGAKIGICRSNDMWDSLTYKRHWADDINDEIYRFFRFYFEEGEERPVPKNTETDWNVFKKVTTEITIDKIEKQNVIWDRRNVIFSDFIDSEHKNLYEFLAKEVFNPVKNKFKIQNIKNFSVIGQHEVWTDAECFYLGMYELTDFQIIDFLERTQAK
jgi:hypothetical protein